MKRFPIVLLAFVLLSLMSISAQAEDCNRFTQNAEWKEKFPQLKEEIETGNYTSALETAKVLHGICSRSPALNYLTGVALLKTGDLSRARTSFQKASEYTSEFETEPEMARRIWFARYEAEYPEKSDESISAMKDKIKALEDDNKSILINTAADNAKLVSENKYNDVITSKKLEQENEVNIKRISAMMWSGTAIGGTGIALSIVGGILAFSNDQAYNDVTNDIYSPIRKYKIDSKYATGMGLFGAGIGMIIAGAITAGLGGYYYVQQNETNDSSVAVNFDFSLNHVEMGVSF